MDCAFRGCRFVDCRLSGINWTVTQSLENPQFTECVLDDANFSEMSLVGAEWINCRARTVDFSQCDLERASFRGSQLRGAMFASARLHSTNFEGAVDVELDPETVRLSKTRLEVDAVVRLVAQLGVEVVGMSDES